MGGQQQPNSPPLRSGPYSNAVFESEGLTRARAAIEPMLRADDGHILITGRPGVGKTLLLGMVERELRQRPDVEVVRLSPLSWNAGMNSVRDRGRPAFGIADDAGDFGTDDLTELLLLAWQCGMRLVLAGQSSVIDLIDPAEMVAHRLCLAPLAADEVAGYVAHRYRLAGSGEVESIDAEALALVAACSEGVPAFVNMIMGQALMRAEGAGVARVLPSHIAEVVRDNAYLLPAPPPAPAATNEPVVLVERPAAGSDAIAVVRVPLAMRLSHAAEEMVSPGLQVEDTHEPLPAFAAPLAAPVLAHASRHTPWLSIASAAVLSLAAGASLFASPLKPAVWRLAAGTVPVVVESPSETLRDVGSTIVPPELLIVEAAPTVQPASEADADEIMPAVGKSAEDAAPAFQVSAGAPSDDPLPEMATLAATVDLVVEKAPAAAGSPPDASGSHAGEAGSVASIPPPVELLPVELAPVELAPVEPRRTSVVPAALPDVAKAAEPTSPPQVVPAPASEPKRIGQQEAAGEIVRARRLIELGNIAAARLLLRHLGDAGVPEALSLLGGTYDAAMLRKWGVLGIRPDPAMAERLYRAADDRRSQTPVETAGK